MAAMTFAACSENDDFLSDYRNDDNAVHFSAQVGKPTALPLKSNPIGTETEQAQYNNGDQVSVETGSQQAVVYTFDGTNWNPESDKYLRWDENGTMEFRAFYPAGKKGASFTTFTMPYIFADLDDLAYADYMTGKTSSTKSAQVNLPMQRQTVRMVIDQISYNDEFPSDKYEVTSVEFHATATEIVGGAPQLLATPQGVSSYKHTDGKFYALLLPNAKAEASKTFITVYVTERDDATVAPIELPITGIPVTEAGKSYSYRLTIGKKAATVKSVEVADWTKGDIIKGVFDPMTTSANTANHSVYIANEGELTPELIEAAVDNGSELKITGVMNASDLSDLKTTLSNTTTAVTTVDLSEVTLETTTSLPQEMFKGNTTLTSVELPKGLTTINSDDFDGCTALTSVTFPEGLTTISSDAFKGCTALTSATLPESLTTIGSDAFNGCTALTTATLPKNLEEIGERAFKGCTSLAISSIPNEVTEIMSESFDGCTGLTDMNFGRNLQRISDKAFYGCTGLTYVYIDRELEEIGRDAFNGCTKLRTVGASGPVTTIKDSAFKNCTSLTRFNCDIDKNGEICSSAFEGCSSLTFVSGLNNAKLEGGVFQNCTSLTSVTIGGDGGISGQSRVFLGCTSLENVTFEQSVHCFGESFFSGCTNLRTIHMTKNRNAPTISSSFLFDGCSNITVYVSEEAKASFDTWEQSYPAIIMIEVDE